MLQLSSNVTVKTYPRQMGIRQGESGHNISHNTLLSHFNYVRWLFGPTSSDKLNNIITKLESVFRTVEQFGFTHRKPKVPAARPSSSTRKCSMRGAQKPRAPSRADLKQHFQSSNLLEAVAYHISIGVAKRNTLMNTQN